jgi:hypothetical protein
VLRLRASSQMNRQLRPLLVAAVLIAPAFGQVATANCGHSAVANFSPNLQPKANAFLASLKAAVRAQDKREVAGMARYPLLINMPKRHRQIMTSAQLLAEYDRLFTTAIRKAIEEQTPERLFANWPGVMIGNGEVWFEEQPTGSMKIKGTVLVGPGVAFHFSGNPTSRPFAAIERELRRHCSAFIGVQLY